MATSFPENQALNRLPATERSFGWRDHASLWFSLGVGLLVMQMGAYLVPAIGTRDAVLAIVLGTALGAGLLAWTARLGADSGLTSAGLMHATFGSWFAKLPVFLNIAQLIGWTTFELVIMRNGTVAMGSQYLSNVGATLLWGGVLLLLLCGSMTQLVRKVIGHFGLPLVIVSLLWLSWQFGAKVQAHGWSAFMSRAGDGSMGMLSAMDLVVAMPVSWLPLVADYARHGRSGRSAFSGTWTGYAVANVWCYALGVMVASVSAPDADLVATLLLAQGGLVALSLILVDEIDNAYGDVYSGAVCSHSLLPKWSIQRWGLVLALVCTALALVLPMRGLQPFLLVLSSVFVPLYGVILGRLGWRWVPASDSAATTPAVDYWAAGIWLLGIAVFQSLTVFAPEWGATLPTLLLTGVLALVSRGWSYEQDAAHSHG